MELHPGARLGRYEILSLAGSGGMGDVYRARDPRLDRVVAIKVLPAVLANDPVRVGRLEREARTTAALAHPNICAVYDTGHEGSCIYYVSEYVDGEMLRDRLLRGAMPLADVFAIAEPILEAVEYAHHHHVLHRDIKPSNIMLSKDGVKLLDFGLAAFTAPAFLCPDGRVNDTVSLTADGVFVGTLQYAAPEQLEGRPVDERTDLFAFGAVLYEMLTGTRAFPGDTPASVIAAVLSADPRPIPTFRQDVSAALDRFVSRLLAKDPDKRWQTARDALAELQWMQDEPRVTAPRASSGRWMWFWIAAATVTIVAGAGFSQQNWAVRTVVLPPVSIPLDISAPPGTTFFPNMTAMSVSPDGRHVAFLASSGGQPQELWLHDLETRTSRRVEATRGAYAPFWSSDSRTIGFELDDRLQTTDLAGAAPQTLAVPGHSIFGAAWSDDGTLLFNGGLMNALLRVSAGGGAPSPATRLDRSRNELQHNWPQFLPDGRRFIFLSINDRRPATTLWLASLDSEERVRLLDDVSGAQYAAPGYLLFARQDLLYAQSFDATTGRLSGEPTLVLEHVAFTPPNGRSNFSVSSAGVLAYRSAPPEAPISLLDRAGHHLAEIGEPGYYQEPAVSPDGGKVAVMKLNRTSEGRNIWVFDLATQIGTQVTSDADWKSTPVWSPDGRQLVFSVTHVGRMLGLFSFQSGRTELSTLDRPTLLNDWSTDGRFLSSQSARENPGASQLLTLIAMHGDALPWPSLPQAPTAREGRFSPDGRWIAYQARESGRWEVYLSTFPSGLKKILVSSSGGVEPRWRRDGKELFFITPDGWLMAARLDAAGLPTAAPERLCPLASFGVRGPASVRGPYDVTADGQHFVVVSDQNISPAWPIDVLVNWTAKLPRN